MARSARVFGGVVTGLVAIFSFAMQGGCGTNDAAGPSTKPAGVAVVELFASQGCSSCPPAEAVLADVQKESAKAGRPVYPLVFHVDYWNHLGWADPFSDPAYTARQQGYASALHLDSLYTPQMIVNGRTQFVGSNRPQCDRAIADALATPATDAVTAVVTADDANGHKLVYTVEGPVADSVLNVAVVEDNLSTKVERGENGGQTLDQPSVVRWFKTVRLEKAGPGQISIPALRGVDSKNAHVLVYIQKSDSRTITGATAVALQS
jgi:hypothetical protein